MTPGSSSWYVLFFLLTGVFALSARMLQLQASLRRLDKKLNALLKAQGVQWPHASPEVQRLAQDAGKKIAAIKLHRDENPGLSIAEAKIDVEALAAYRS